MKKKFDYMIFILTLLPLFVGCSIPESVVIQSDSRIKLSVSNSQEFLIPEYSDSYFILLLSSSMDEDVIIEWQIRQLNGNSATEDFEQTNGSAIIPKGEVSFSVHLPIKNDLLYEPNEKFRWSFTDPKNKLDTEASYVDFTLVDDETALAVMVEQSLGQSDPALSFPVNFTLEFSRAIDPTTLTDIDIINNGDASSVTWSLTSSDNIIWTLAATGFSAAGTIIPSINADQVSDLNGNTNLASTSTDNTVTYPATPNVSFDVGSNTFDEHLGSIEDPWSGPMGAWSKRVKIRFRGSGIATNITDFPLLVKLNGSRIDYGDFNANGADIRFIDSDNSTALDFEIETWNPAGDSYIWVKVPQIDALSNTDYIYLYYSNLDATDAQNTVQIWDGNYKGVWHLNSNVNDATSNLAHGTNTGSTITASPTGVGRDFDGASYITLPDNMLFGETVLSLSLWFKTSSPGVLFGQQNTIFPINSSSYVPNVHITSAGILKAQYWTGSSSPIASVNPVTDNNWHHVVLVGNINTQSLYLDGTLLGTLAGTISHATMTYNQIGAAYANNWSGMTGNAFSTGTIDEVRISNSARSADWIRTSYLSGIDELTTIDTPTNQYNQNVLVQLNIPALLDITVPYTISGSSSSPSDHNLADGNLIIPAGDTSGYIGLTINTNVAAEGDETVIINLQTPTNADLGGLTTFTLTITDFVNSAPIAVADSSTGLPNALQVISALSNDSDPDTDSIEISGVTQGNYGSVTFTGTQISYQPALEFTGVDTFTYTVSDIYGSTDTATVTITVRSDFNWTGAGGDSDWTTANNWYGTVAPGSSDTIYFSDSFCGSSCNSNISGTITVFGMALSHNFTQTVTQDIGVALTVRQGHYHQYNGNFMGGDSTIKIYGSAYSNFFLHGGTFTSTTDTLQIRNNWTHSGGTFDPNNGLVLIGVNGYSEGNSNFYSALTQFYNLEFKKYNDGYNHVYLDSATNVTVLNKFTWDRGGCRGSGTLNIKGDADVNSGWASDNLANFIVNGSVDQTIWGSGLGYFNNLNINSTGGTVYITGSLRIRHDLIYTLGNVDATASNLIIGRSSYAEGDSTFDTGVIEWNDAEIRKYGDNYNDVAFTSPLIVKGNLTLTSGIYLSGNIDVYGDLVIDNGSSYSLANITLKGTAVQNISHNGGIIPGTVFSINKTGGSVNLLTNFTQTKVGQDFNLVGSNIDMAGFDLTIKDQLTLNGNILNKNTGILTVNTVIQGTGSLFGGTVNP